MPEIRDIVSKEDLELLMELRKRLLAREKRQQEKEVKKKDAG